jgi:hypothetical protein
VALEPEEAQGELRGQARSIGEAMTTTADETGRPAVPGTVFGHADDTGGAVAATALAELGPTGASQGATQDGQEEGGLPPIVWGSLLVIATLGAVALLAL